MDKIFLFAKDTNFFKDNKFDSFTVQTYGDGEVIFYFLDTSVTVTVKAFENLCKFLDIKTNFNHQYSEGLGTLIQSSVLIQNFGENISQFELDKVYKDSDGNGDMLFQFHQNSTNLELYMGKYKITFYKNIFTSNLCNLIRTLNH